MKAAGLLVVLPLVLTSGTAFAQADKQMMIKRDNSATTTHDSRALNPQPIPPGKTDAGSRVLPPNPCKEASCSDRALNPQPIPPGKTHALNPQPIPPGTTGAGQNSPKAKKKKKSFVD